MISFAQCKRTLTSIIYTDHPSQSSAAYTLINCNYNYTAGLLVSGGCLKDIVNIIMNTVMRTEGNHQNNSSKRKELFFDKIFDDISYAVSLIVKCSFWTSPLHLLASKNASLCQLYSSLQSCLKNVMVVLYWLLVEIYHQISRFLTEDPSP